MKQWHRVIFLTGLIFVVLFCLAGCQSVYVRYETMGGQRIADQRVTSKEALVLPVPIKEGYAFLGWYTDPTYLYSFENDTIVSQDVTLYALWVKSSYTVSFETNGGEGMASQVILFNTPVSIHEIPFKTKHTFSGWYLDAALTEPLAETRMPSNNLTLYAKWVPHQYPVDFDTQGGSPRNSLLVYDGSMIEMQSIPMKYEHTFLGWYLSPYAAQPYDFSSPVTRPLTLYARWEINQYRLILKVPGQYPDYTLLIDFNAILPLDDMTKEGHTLIGWFGDPSLTQSFNLTHMPNRDLTLYSKWALNTDDVQHYDHPCVAMKAFYAQERTTRLLGH